MKDKNQPDISKPTSKIPWHKTPAGIAYRNSLEYKSGRKAYRQRPEVKNKRKEHRRKSERRPEAKIKRKEYYYRTREARLAEKKRYRQRNKENVHSKSIEYRKQRIKKDPLYAVKTKLRNIVYETFRRIGMNKPTDTLTLLGCSWEEAKTHFESLFKEGMSWDNHGEWHIDHIRPVASFTEKDLHLMNDISNLQPLWAEENLKKSNKINSTCPGKELIVYTQSSRTRASSGKDRAMRR